MSPVTDTVLLCRQILVHVIESIVLIQKLLLMKSFLKNSNICILLKDNSEIFSVFLSSCKTCIMLTFHSSNFG